MPTFSASDFERFSRRIGADADARAEAMIADARHDAEAKQAAAEAQAQQWLADARQEEEEELRRREAEAKRAVKEAVREGWAQFLAQRQREVETGLAAALSEAFPELAACFIRKIAATYPDGTFALPAVYAPLVDRARFGVGPETGARIVFTRGPLYIEFSAARLQTELGEAIAETVREDAASWPA